jgi:hypothetical protein
MSGVPPARFRKRRIDAAIDACAVWATVFLTYIGVGLLLAWKLVRSIQRKLRLRRADADD